ncbi:hypothetical protein GSY63_06135 [Mucilaginibacter sp. R11]|uniref:Uncharacterized protein n=2 Tax=Mucilaginibacter agri TaxID=2695265 RepID=A0A965ZFN8_9SPHI|nr:hypothetical protein [Mucilaginibacter agri]
MPTKLLSFWQLIKIIPEKWQEENYGQAGGGFWAVAILDTQVIWYNDIEDGFNISPYKTPGTIAKYYCDQYSLTEILFQILNSK